MTKTIVGILMGGILFASSFGFAMYQPTAVDTQIVSTFSAKITTMYQANPIKIKNIGTKLAAITQMFGEDTMEYYVLDALYRHIMTLSTQETVTVVVPASLPSTAEETVTIVVNLPATLPEPRASMIRSAGGDPSVDGSFEMEVPVSSPLVQTTPIVTMTNTNTSSPLPISSTATSQGQALSTLVNGAYIKGNPGAEFTLVEFGDFQCPFCQRFNLSNAVEDMLSHYNGKVNTVFVDFPLSTHPLARDAALAAECVGAQTGSLGYHRYKHELYFLGFTDIAKSIEALDHIGVDIDRAMFDTCVANNTYGAQIQADYDLGINLGVNGTPTSIFLNRTSGQFKVIPGVPTAERLIEIIDELEPNL